MKSIRLTPKQKEIFDLLTAYKTGCLYKHVKPTGLICYRLLDDKRNPVMNIRFGIVDDLIDKQVLETSGHELVLKASSEVTTAK